MILKLNDRHKDIVLNYVGKEPSINLFIIGDIEQYGFDKDFQEVWGSFDEKNNLTGVLLRYNNNFIPYIENLNEDVSDFKKIIKSYKGNKFISGKSDIIEKFKDILNDFEEKYMYFCQLKEKSKLLKWDDSIKVATEKDASRIHELIDTIDEFSVQDSVKEIEEKIRDNNKVVYYIENEKKEIITVSQITAENSKSAMVVGVATRKDYREKGYMSKCLSKLCSDFIDKNKSLCLFYDNPKAGSVYKKIGFEEIGTWIMLVERKN
ncbi:GCN5-related N-acetyltransferase [[Clostridium] sordellii]|uniref:GNAT family N-acetyltransferase n=1 Tax=Paraclostridium sordellii TaxID=1505 RepID=UPI0005DE37FA|nr:GNAT family N-acetyltransferase [Paeniclostridium sordellii]CEQ21362.1 GCN5-related N-acetyltransferase [[Clostridium] sordellii] [Paeniclostridium sordellii]